MNQAMVPNTIHRYHSLQAAKLVKEQMDRLTSVRTYVDRDPVSENDKNRGVGDYAITHCEKSDSFRTYRFSRCANMGLTLALADALREVNPNHPLLTTWHLRPENRDKLHRYEV